jgi:hypothetical protein
MVSASAALDTMIIVAPAKAGAQFFSIMDFLLLTSIFLSP